MVRALHTPGHRPEHTAFALIDTERGPEPWAVLTGDSLFVGGIARPDLAVDPREGAHGIFHSLHDRLLTLPDTCEVWPGHLEPARRGAGRHRRRRRGGGHLRVGPQRAAVGASLLARHGAREVVHVVDGGVGSWARQGWPLQEGGR